MKRQSIAETSSGEIFYQMMSHDAILYRLFLLFHITHGLVSTPGKKYSIIF